MNRMTWILLAATACAHAPSAIDENAQLDAARVLFEQNIRAIQERDREAYLGCYLSTDALVRVGDDGVKLGYVELAEGTAPTGSDDWPESLEASDLQVHRVADGVIYGAYRYVVVIDGKRSEGWSERVFVRRDGRWWIAVTTAFGLASECVPPEVNSSSTAIPDWVARGTEATTVEGKAVLHGMGSIAGMKSTELAENTAANKAKTQVTRLATKLFEAVVAEWAAEHPEPVENDVEAIGQCGAVMARPPEGEIVGRWVSPSGEHFALARIDLDEYIRAIEEIDVEATELKAFVRERGFAQHRAMSER